MNRSAQPRFAVRMIAWMLAALAFAWIAAPAAAQQDPPKDYFGRRTTEQPPPGAAQPDARQASSFRMPVFLQRTVAQVAEWQRELTTRLSEEVRAYKESGAWAPALALILISFLYGVFHAAGPGHGKMVTTTYFLANRAAAMQGVVMGVLIALVQACSAVAIVSVLSLVLSIGASRIVGSLTIVELISYALIAGFGLYMLYGFISGKACDHHHHGPTGHAHDAHGHHDHGHTTAVHRHDHAHAHDHAHNHAHDHAPDRSTARLEQVAAAERLPAMIWRMLPIAVIAGLRPCTGAILVLLFALANGVYFLGVISTFAMAVGVAITVSLLGLGTIWVRRLVAVTTKPGARTAAIAHRTIGIVGGLLILTIALLLLLGTWERSGFRL